MDNNVPRRINDLVATGRNQAERPSTSELKTKRRKKSLFKPIALTVAIVLLLTALGLGGWSLYRSSTGAQIDKSKYQVVVFKDGVNYYFGKLQDLNNGYFKLNNVFYIQTQSSDKNDTQQVGTAKDLKLVKLGEELHGPEDEMIISKDQVSYFENLKPDGKVSQAITNYYGKK